MKTTMLTKDLVPVHELRANLATWLDRPSETGRPVVVTQRGRASAVLVSPAMLDELEDSQNVVREVLRGLREIEAGEMIDDDDVWADVDDILARSPNPVSPGT
jgi:prevent-host-death family protein